MAEFNGTEYAQLYLDPKQLQAVQGRDWGGYFFARKMSHTQPSAGVADDTILVGKAPPFGAAHVNRFIIEFSAWGAGALLDLGWDAYRNSNDVLVPADTQGLIAGLSIATAGRWAGGTEAAAEVVYFDARAEATLRVTIRGAALPQDATFTIHSKWTC